MLGRTTDPDARLRVTPHRRRPRRRPHLRPERERRAHERCEAGRARGAAAEGLIAEAFGLTIPVVTRTDQLAEVVRRDPLKSVVESPKRYQVSFLSAAPDAAIVRKLEALGARRRAVHGRRPRVPHVARRGRRPLLEALGRARPQAAGGGGDRPQLDDRDDAPSDGRRVAVRRRFAPEGYRRRDADCRCSELTGGHPHEQAHDRQPEADRDLRGGAGQRRRRPHGRAQPPRVGAPRYLLLPLSRRACARPRVATITASRRRPMSSSPGQARSSSTMMCSTSAQWDVVRVAPDVVRGFPVPARMGSR